MDSPVLRTGESTIAGGKNCPGAEKSEVLAAIGLAIKSATMK